ncbi:hypothetical protein SODALDRAFT_330820 [Sodiomyces alkalinus F11]|uniref:Ribosome biogenesis protein SLX9 n=1 Tax=Sodiomyces alkalinus (strain CBS 110278 / VKM F-3762 / F11) TaxID=1314773 RepID=A0A3N2Q2W5_SODAK|nr:hypothetical protein SODALDRAFT_330820 [Sodiomyces alkalinus F11]ROT41109.1 hypothetical protein SODALDRAFT_330820 [Sodiomyces alkalinus F11]
MAPTKPLSAREKRLARIRGDIPAQAPHKTHRPEAVVPDGFLSTKRDKRIIKHSVLLSKVQKSAATTSSSSNLKRRRPNKKLVATLESLADALPELNEAELSRPAEGKIRHKSLRSRPGALKRKERLVRGEMARFGASMAALAALPESKTATTTTSTSGMDVENEDGKPSTTPAPSTTGRWAALRRHIASTMDQNPAFATQSSTSGNG